MARSYCLTAFNLEEAYALSGYEKMKYLILGQEKSPTTGRTHYQGYIELTCVQRVTALKKIAPTTHFETRKGTAKQAAEYCKKDGDFIEYGQISNQGKRTDVDTVKEILKTTGRMNDVMEATTSYQAARFGELYLKYRERKRNWKPYVVWIYGPTGCGKSKLARERLPGENVYTKNDASKWFFGYDAEEDVILDDFRDSWMPYTDLLSLLDRYERRVELKGGSRQFLAKNIIITSKFAPGECYRHARGDPIDQLLRRIDEIINMRPPEEENEEDNYYEVF